ncbi:hypothetical protein FRACYDRAFT_256132 [Fragilariopsis cylindrus CCMP1102]|uniref:Uncharacterized protein n=1 Tax=Fragilariopsis cylindrus CCMP1102 TaxID=635003 RepID=A0A1E7EJP4_9STRA|nr:hypothetical protein FRACYDRAFT_256132 [Fragilariopsis cylindrus CCMP1102]|eukprot:OEU06136.1 hypothetical protein FRACYDRAFT_256132 [Fragilariopsis cylindrus CCMP1102]
MLSSTGLSYIPVTAAQWKAFHCVCDLMGDFAKVLPHIEHENVLNQLYHLQQHNARNYEVQREEPAKKNAKLKDIHNTNIMPKGRRGGKKPTSPLVLCLLQGIGQSTKTNSDVSTPKECSKVKLSELLPWCDRRTDAKSGNREDKYMIEPHRKRVCYGMKHLLMGTWINFPSGTYFSNTGTRSGGTVH